MILDEFSYITLSEMTGNIRTDVGNLFEQNGKSRTFTHVVNVARVNSEIAKQFGLDIDKCIIGGLLHDISAIISPKDMLKYAQDNDFKICDAELTFPFLLHQKVSKIIAIEYFDIIDHDILSSIECHTTLKSNPSKYDMALFIADKLAWDQDGIPPFYHSVEAALNLSLEKACYEYMTFMNDNGKVLCPHINWNLACEWLAFNTRV